MMQWIDNSAGRSVAGHLARSAMLAALLAGCGGGVDSGGTGGSSFTSGAITGFGSVIVNSVHFDDTSASVADLDGTPRSRDDLRLGMTTEIRGSDITPDPSGVNTSSARTIVFGGEIVGPIESIDVAGNRIVALGQTVDINANTVFDDTTVSSGLASLAVGNVIEAYALFDAASGHYIATRIERKATAATYRLRAIVSNLNPTGKTFDLGAQHVSYAAVPGGAPVGLANGNTLLVRLKTAKVGGLWVVAALDDAVQRPRDMDEVRIEGVIGKFTSATQFSVKGVSVDASHIAPPAGLAAGVRVEVEGVASGDVLIADKVEIETDRTIKDEGFELRGPIKALDVAQLTFVIRNVTVSYSLTTTDFRNGDAANLALGANVEARGVLSPDGTRLVATRVTFK